MKEVQSRQEGQLSKFTNVVKGWQYRWFVLEPETGQLDYYLPEDRARSRGSQVSGMATGSNLLICRLSEISFDHS